MTLRDSPPVRAWRWIFPVEHFTVTSDLPPAALVDATRARLPRRGLLGFLGFGRRPRVVGSVGATRVRLRYRGGWVENSADPVFVGRVRASGQGALIDGTFQAPRVVQAFFFMWSSFIVLWMVLATAITIGSPRGFILLPVVVLLPVAMLTFGVTINRWGAARRRRAMEAMAALLIDAAKRPIG